jgi:hypothetical protein
VRIYGIVSFIDETVPLFDPASGNLIKFNLCSFFVGYKGEESAKADLERLKGMLLQYEKTKSISIGFETIWLDKKITDTEQHIKTVCSIFQRAHICCIITAKGKECAGTHRIKKFYSVCTCLYSSRYCPQSTLRVASRTK